jgi:hypothetical protein
MKLFKLIEDVVKLPVAVVKDTITLGGTLNGDNEPQTLKTLKDIDEDIFEENK